jgi:competence protein ComFA
MKCLRCGNEDPAYFYKGSKGYYCRKCIRFSRILFEEEPESYEYELSEGCDEYRFEYELTKEQKQASRKCVEALKESDVLLYCVCGAGKTEISIESIASFLSRGLKVAYAIARKEVVIELEKRFAKIFKQARIVAVYGGHHEQLSGDLIVCTCHQLYRYYRSFDLLIIDEVDAFPLKGNETLMNICLNASRGRIIFSTATVDEGLKRILEKRNCQKVSLYTRPSYTPLSVPEIYYRKNIFSLLCLNRIMSLMANQGIIFVTSRKECLWYYRIFSHFYSCTYVYSDLDKRKQNIEDFRKGVYRFIFTTTVLERGITIKNVDVVIMNSKKIFDSSNLVQMLGRVGRGLDSKGHSYIISDRHYKVIDDTITYLRKANSYL